MKPIKRYTFPVGLLDCNCSILICPETKAAAIIDPGGHIDKIISIIQNEKAYVQQIILTHAHFDHALGLDELTSYCNNSNQQYDVNLHEADHELYQNLHTQGQRFGFPVETVTTKITNLFKDQDQINFGEQSLNVIYTPGHSPGSSCLYLPQEQLLFAGDTLFQQGIGRTDLFGGDHAAIMQSITTKLLTLNDNTTVITGHGEMTTIGQEKKLNPYLR